MKRTLVSALLVFLFPTCLLGRSAYQVYRMPATGPAPGWGSIARQALPSVGQVTSSSSGNWTIPFSSASTVVTAPSLTTTGRPVLLIFQTDGSSSGSHILLSSQTVSVCSLIFNIRRDGSTLASPSVIGSSESTSSPYGTSVSPPALWYFDSSATAGSHVYDVQAYSSSTSCTGTITNFNLTAYEL